jgi:Carboxylesterase family
VSSAGTSSPGSGGTTLAFDASKYTVRTKSVSAASGTKKVTYRYYKDIVYVANPVDTGRDNEKNGKYYGKAPAAILDLKAAVRYIRYNKRRLPGNPDWIVTSGGSAGGALSTLLAASGDSSLYSGYLAQLGAADASDAIFASASYSPITDLG